ncbi:GntR family transcriptional regulator [Aminobacter aganoensis]|uniref:DNA-binding GntR family transcriptional regulator n=1 Tax=Aminobacter aganoensis TaxID=83264 RepID=A0A7X0KL54_9HYPH|nr:FCD domain-containing protein [Aminobacter aganoensis]MBB6354689.1 DNA-binding GntR family transcriptional regulator [Aminobacter aganoensis]
MHRHSRQSPVPEPEFAESEGSLADRAYRLIRDDILNGVFPAGEPLRLAVLRDRYGLSFSPLREALTRLSSDRLAELASLRGFRVAGVSLDEMWDVIGIRILVESEALRRAVSLGTDDWEARVVASFHAFGKAVARHELQAPQAEGTFDQALEDRHQGFHHALISACGSPALLDIAAQLYTRTERYRRPVLSDELRARPRNLLEEHSALMKAALQRDGEGAVRLLAEHYRRTGELIEAGLKNASTGAGAGKTTRRRAVK